MEQHGRKRTPTRPARSAESTPATNSQIALTSASPSYLPDILSEAGLALLSPGCGLRAEKGESLEETVDSVIRSRELR